MTGWRKRTCETVFVDFFDTLMFRKVTPYQVLERWALCIGRKYPDIPEEYVHVLPGIRGNVFKQCREELEKRKLETGISEVNYETAMGRVYKKIARIAEVGEEKEFVEISGQTFDKTTGKAETTGKKDLYRIGLLSVSGGNPNISQGS